MRLIIDPPVHPYSPPAELRAWLQELEGKRGRWEGEPSEEVCEWALEEARRCLTRSGGRSVTANEER